VEGLEIAIGLRPARQISGISMIFSSIRLALADRLWRFERQGCGAALYEPWSTLMRTLAPVGEPAELMKLSTKRS